MWILDRWGQKIFHGISADQPWDGTYYNNNEQCQVGVYVYVITVKDLNGRAHVYNGRVTLVK